MTVDVRVLIYSSSAAVLAGIESALRDGAAGDGHRLVPSHARRYSDLAARIGEVEPHVAILHGLDRHQIASWGRWRRTALVLAVQDAWCGPDILHAVRAGIGCLVSIDTDLQAIVPTCADAALGRSYLSPPLLDKLLAYLSGDGDPAGSTRLGLTARESQVLRHLAAGRSQADISRVMRISTRTVKHHLGNVYRKLGVHGQSEAIVLAYRDGLVA